MRIILLCVLLSGVSVHAALDPEIWVPATEAQRAGAHPAASGLFFVYNNKRDLFGYAGNPKLDPSVTASEASKEKFLSSMLAGMAKTGVVVKEKVVKPIRGINALFCVTELPGGRQALACFCFSQGRFVNLTVSSLSPLSWDDPDVVTLVNELPVGP